MTPRLTPFVPVLRTGHLMHFDWACAALDDAGIPYQRREETSGGLCVAMPVAPTPGPGVWWTLLVPESWAAHAKEVVVGLPFEPTTAPDVWSYQPKPLGRLLWQGAIWILLANVAISFVLFFLGGRR